MASLTFAQYAGWGMVEARICQVGSTSHPVATQAASEPQALEPNSTGPDDAEHLLDVQIDLDALDPPESTVLPPALLPGQDLAVTLAGLDAASYYSVHLRNFELLMRMTRRFELVIPRLARFASPKVRASLREIFYRIGDAIKAFVTFVYEYKADGDPMFIIRIGATELSFEVARLYEMLDKVWARLGRERDDVMRPAEFPADLELFCLRGAQPPLPKKWVTMLVLGGAAEGLFRRHPQLERPPGMQLPEVDLLGDMRGKRVWELMEKIQDDG